MAGTKFLLTLTVCVTPETARRYEFIVPAARQGQLSSASSPEALEIERIISEIAATLTAADELCKLVSLVN